ncbi:MAG: serine/threonine-protein kinase [Planctomycetota bacterium]|nr:serine/threonine-protein kinase [Planctomycetota bacterium]
MEDQTIKKLDLLDLQDERWTQGDYVSVEEILLRLPHSESITDQDRLDLIWNERIWRSRLTEQQEADCVRQEFRRRFPSLENGIYRQFECERALGASFSDEDDSLDQFESTGLGAGDACLRVPRIPNHYIIEEFASGGCSIVYRARQLVPDREVALKILDYRTLLTGTTKELHQEAEWIGQLRHRNIIEVYHAGVSEGSPYLTMPLVKGGSLQSRMGDYSNRFREIVRLMIPIAQAVDYAHQLGVLHCDIKPSNILMDGDRPLLADFGMAVSKHLVPTITGGTPAYMAPEQFSGHPGQISVSTDIYGLGAVLYHLLTGKHPGQTKQWKPAAFARTCNRQIPRDLEAICMKCLAGESQMRYQSAGELIKDLESFLAGKPVLARPLNGPNYPERLYKLAYRAPWAAAFVATIVISLPLLAIQNRQLRTVLSETENQRDKADELAEISFALGALGVERSAKALAVGPYERSEQLLSLLTKQKPGTLSYRLRLAKTRKNLASLYLDLGQTGQAESMLKMAIADLEWLKKRPDAPPETLAELADGHANYGNLHLRFRDTDEAVNEFRIAKSIREQLCELSPDDFSKNFDLCKSELDTGNALLDLGQHSQEAETHLLKAVEGMKRLIRGPITAPDVAKLLTGASPMEQVVDRLQQATINLGYLYFGQDRFTEAEELFREAENLVQTLLDANPNVSNFVRFQAAVRTNLGLCYTDSGRFDSASKILKLARDQFRSLLKVEGANYQSLSQLGKCLLEISRNLHMAQKTPSLAIFEEARLAALDALEVCDQLKALDPTLKEHISLESSIQRVLGDIAYKASEIDPAQFNVGAHHYNQFLALSDSLAKTMEPDKLTRLDVLNNFGRLCIDRGEFAEACILLELGIRETEQLARESRNQNRLKSSFLALYNAMGIVAASKALSAPSSQTDASAKPLLREAINHFTCAIKAATGSENAKANAIHEPLVIHSLFARATVYEKLGQLKEAIVDLDIALSSPGIDAMNEQHFNLARNLAMNGDHKKAELKLSQMGELIQSHRHGFYHAACIYSLMYAAALKDPAIESDPSQKQPQQYLDSAIDMLKKAQNTGFFESTENRDLYKNEQDLIAIRQEEVFVEFNHALMLEQAMPQ